MKAFDITFGNDFTVLLKSLFAFKPEVCEMDGNLRLPNRQNLLSRVYPCDACPKRRMPWSQLDALHDFQNLSLFLEIAILRNS